MTMGDDATPDAPGTAVEAATAWWVIPLLCAVCALALGGFTARVASAPYGHRVSALVHMSASDGVATQARASDTNFAFVPPGSHYDGTYFYAVARDPLARGAEHTRIDVAAYRYGHAGLGLLAFLVSAGRPHAIPRALLAINLLAMAMAAWCASRLAVELGRSPWAGMLVGLSPGLLYAVANDTSEPLSAALLGAGLLAWHRGCHRLAALVFVPMCLTKEPLVLVPAAIGLWEVVCGLRGRPSARGREPAALRQWTTDVVALAVGPLVFVGWLAYLQARFGQSPLGGTQGRLTRPLGGFLDSVRFAAGLVTGDANSSQIGGAALPMLVVTAAALLLGCLVAARVRTALDLAYLATAGVALCVSLLAVAYPKDLLRITVIPALLLPAVLATSRRPLPAWRADSGSGE